MTSLGRFIHRKREEKGLTVRELEDLTSLSYSLISRYESGSRTPNLRAIHRLKEALDFTHSEYQYVLKLQGCPTSEVTLGKKGGVQIIWTIVESKLKLTYPKTYQFFTPTQHI